MNDLLLTDPTEICTPTCLTLLKKLKHNPSSRFPSKERHLVEKMISHSLIAQNGDQLSITADGKKFLLAISSPKTVPELRARIKMYRDGASIKEFCAATGRRSYRTVYHYLTGLKLIAPANDDWKFDEPLDTRLATIIRQHDDCGFGRWCAYYQIKPEIMCSVLNAHCGKKVAFDQTYLRYVQIFLNDFPEASAVIASPETATVEKIPRPPRPRSHDASIPWFSPGEAIRFLAAKINHAKSQENYALSMPDGNVYFTQSAVLDALTDMTRNKTVSEPLLGSSSNRSKLLSLVIAQLKAHKMVWPEVTEAITSLPFSVTNKAPGEPLITRQYFIPFYAESLRVGLFKEEPEKKGFLEDVESICFEQHVYETLKEKKPAVSPGATSATQGQQHFSNPEIAAFWSKHWTALEKPYLQICHALLALHDQIEEQDTPSVIEKPHSYDPEFDLRRSTRDALAKVPLWRHTLNVAEAIATQGAGPLGIIAALGHDLAKLKAYSAGANKGSHADQSATLLHARIGAMLGPEETKEITETVRKHHDSVLLGSTPLTRALHVAETMARKAELTQNVFELSLFAGVDIAAPPTLSAAPIADEPAPPLTSDPGKVEPPVTPKSAYPVKVGFDESKKQYTVFCFGLIESPLDRLITGANHVDAYNRFLELIQRVKGATQEIESNSKTVQFKKTDSNYLALLTLEKLSCAITGHGDSMSEAVLSLEQNLNAIATLDLGSLRPQIDFSFAV